MRAHRLLVALGATALLVSGCSKSVAQFAVGECYAEQGLETGEYEKLDCTDAGADLQVVGLVDVGDPASEPYPGLETVRARQADCPAETVQSLIPTEETWEEADDDQLICLGPVGTTAST